MLVALVVVIFISRLAYLQLGTDRYILNAFNTSIKQEVIYPRRGDILDRNGRLLVTSSNKFEVQITPFLMEKGFDTIQFINLLGITRDYFDKKMSEIKSRKGYTKAGTYPLVEDIDRETFTRFQEQMYNFPAVDVVKRPRREYRVYTAGNILGYIQEVDPSYIKRDSSYYEPGDLAGQSGVEKSYESVLRGIKGYNFLKKDIHLRTIGPYENGEKDVEVVNGKTIKLSIDYKIQEYAESLLMNKRGALVAIEPKSGEILALVSSPYIDPNRFNIPGEVNRMVQDSVDKIMYDRALQATYPPGSPFKMLTGLAGFSMRVIDSTTVYTCHHGFYYGRNRMACHCGRYNLRIREAIERSCNSYFSKAWLSILGRPNHSMGANIDEWAGIMNSFGLGKYLGVDMPVGSKGNIPSSKYYDKILGKNKYNRYQIISNGIGQGEVLTTPIQMANYVCAIANKGYFYTPHIVKEIDGKSQKDTIFTTKRKVKVPDRYFTPILEGMKAVFTGGTARGFISRKFVQAGKTGTAQNPHGQDHSTFTLVAPAENPKIVIAVVVENGYWGSRWAGPIASLVAEKYLFGEVERKGLENKMLKGDLRPEYRRQEIERLKRNGWYVEPKKDSNVIKPII